MFSSDSYSFQCSYNIINYVTEECNDFPVDKMYSHIEYVHSYIDMYLITRIYKSPLKQIANDCGILISTVRITRGSLFPQQEEPGSWLAICI